jgi:hypothetical protein
MTFKAVNGKTWIEHPIYAPLIEAGWEVIRFKTICYAASKGRGSKLMGKGSALKHAGRMECVYRNPMAASASGQKKMEI